MKYIGGKFKARRVIRSYFPRHLKEMVSPFLGGGHVELDCAADGVVVHGHDLYEDLVNFWQRVDEDPEAMMNLAKSYLQGFDKDLFNELYETYDAKLPLERAVIFWIVHRCTFAGGGFRDKWFNENHNFNIESCQKLGQYFNPNLRVKCLDYEEALNNHPSTFAYLDPPYMFLNQKNNFYGRRGSMHEGFDHNRLREVLGNRKAPWVMSYNNIEPIRRLYEGFKQVIPFWHYSMSENPGDAEILIIHEGG